MKKIIKNQYFITSIVTIIILLVLFIGKKIFPFGDNTLIYGDMYDQITAFLYHFYDSFYNNKSLLVDFTTSGGINFVGIMAYYILSPVNLIILFFKREEIYLAISIVIALKILLSSLTSLYAIRYLFKEKLSFLLAVILAISYAFSGYMLLMYQITPWMDTMYLFPLIVVGLKKLFSNEKPYLYIIVLSLSLMTSFYVSVISLMFIFFLSLIYIINYSKESKKKTITALGISTLLACMISMVIILPSFLQITSSSRFSLNLEELLNSKTGPITDKLSFFLPSSFLIIQNILLFLDYKKHKKFLKWYFPSLLILGIPYIVEPINKIFHFFSYAFFPNRYGYMMFFLLTIGAAYYSINQKDNKKEAKAKSISISITLLTSTSAIILTYLNYDRLQSNICKLTISRDKYLILILTFISLTIMIGMWVVRRINNKKRTYYYTLVLLSVHILCNLFVYLGIDNKQDKIKEVYSTMHKLYEIHDNNDVYRLKTNSSSLITNNGMVSSFHNLDHFTSLVNGNNLKFLKQLGYTSHWTKTYSKNGTLFTDIITSNKYYLTHNKPQLKTLYNYVETINSYNLYEFNQDISYGYFTKNISFDKEEHSFSFQNKIYKAITNKDEDLFKIYTDFNLNNIKEEEKNNKTTYKIIDNDKYNNLEMNLSITKKSLVYLEIFNSFDNTEDLSIYKKMNIYINDNLYKPTYPISTNNGSLFLGEFDEDIKITIILDNDITLSYIEIGLMNEGDLLDFIKTQKVDSKIKFNKNKIEVNVNSNTSGLFFIPVTNDGGYTVKINDKDEKVETVYGNYLGVNLEKGKNKIEFTYIPKGLKMGIIISLTSLIITVILFKTNLYQLILNNELITKIIKYIYLILYSLLFIFIYIIPFILFIISYFVYLH